MGNKEIFISYKSEEFDDALWVKTQLEDKGFSCWMAPMSITGGASYASEIPTAIQHCEVFVLILSNACQKSKWVPRELDQAINANKVIMPFMVEKCGLNDEFNFYLSNVQRYYAYIDRDKSFEKMVSDIKTYLGKNDVIEEPEVAETEEDAPTTEIVEPAKKQPKKTKAKKPKQNTLDKKNKFIFSISAAAAAFAIIVVSCIVALVINSKVVIADVAYKKSDYTITIEDTEISTEDLTKFGEFKDLNFVTLKNCSFKTESLEVLGTLELYELELSNCGLTDAQLSSIDFNALENLEGLNLHGNDKLTDLSVIAPVSDTVENLNVSNIAIKNFDWLKDFTKIKGLYIDNTGANDLSCLLNMAYLEVFSAKDNEISTLNGLTNTTVLKSVDLSNNKLFDVSVLSNSASTLQYVTLDNNTLLNLKALETCVELVEVSANNNKLSSVAWTKNLNKLTKLCLSNNQVNSLDGITQSEQLQILDLSKNKLTKVDGLVFGDDNYVEVNLSDNCINTVKLPTNCHYKTLVLNGNQLQDSSFLDSTDGFKVIFNYFDALDLELLKGSSFSDIYIIDCPTNRKVEIENAHYSINLITAKEIEDIIND